MVGHAGSTLPVIRKAKVLRQRIRCHFGSRIAAAGGGADCYFYENWNSALQNYVLQFLLKK